VIEGNLPRRGIRVREMRNRPFQRGARKRLASTTPPGRRPPIVAAVLLAAAACQSARTAAGSELPAAGPDPAAAAVVSTATASREVAAGKGACGGKICERGHFPPASWRPYSSESPFNRKVPPNPKLMAGSEKIVERLLGDLSKQKQPANLPVYDDGTGGWPTYWGTSADPAYRTTCKWGDCSAAHLEGRAPAGAVMQGGNDAPRDDANDRHLTFVDQTIGTEFDLWHVETSPLPADGGTVVAEWAGITKIDGDGLAGCAKGVCRGEGNAGRVGNLAGRVRFEELAEAIARRSYIDHALSITVRCTDGTTVYPASTNFGMACKDKNAHIAKGNPFAPPMGARLRLNLTNAGAAADLARIDGKAMSKVPEWKKVFLRTLVIYGAIVMDTGTDFYFAWQTESGNQYTSMKVADPWLQFARRMATNPATGKPHTDCWTGPPGADWQVDCQFRRGGDGYLGVWKDKDDGLEWRGEVWSHLEVLHECVSKGAC
jgi:hypothetical protein